MLSFGENRALPRAGAKSGPQIEWILGHSIGATAMSESSGRSSRMGVGYDGVNLAVERVRERILEQREEPLTRQRHAQLSPE